MKKPLLLLLLLPLLLCSCRQREPEEITQLAGSTADWSVECFISPTITDETLRDFALCCTFRYPLDKMYEEDGYVSFFLGWGKDRYVMTYHRDKGILGLGYDPWGRLLINDVKMADDGHSFWVTFHRFPPYTREAADINGPGDHGQHYGDAFLRITGAREWEIPLFPATEESSK